MVQFKINIHIVLLVIAFSITGCKKKLDNISSMEDEYCFKIIQDSLKTGQSSIYKNDSNCFRIVEDELLKHATIKEKGYFSSVEKFYQNTFFSESYVLEKKGIQYLILIGQSKGATGIGVNYWNYECYVLNHKNNIIRFSSLAKTPYSIFFDKGILEYITIDDNYPRPASGVIKLKYYPVIGSLYSENGKLLKEVEYNCGK